MYALAFLKIAGKLTEMLYIDNGVKKKQQATDRY